MIPLNVLALQLRRIGDLLLTTPALWTMRQAGVRVTLALSEGCAPLLPMLLGTCVDEALVVHATATVGVEVRSTGSEELTAYLFSGPDLHPEAALLGAGWAR